MKSAHLSQTFLTSPNRGVNYLQEELSGSGIEYKYGTINRFGGQISFKRFVYRYSINVSVINEPKETFKFHFQITNYFLQINIYLKYRKLITYQIIWLEKSSP